MGGSDDKRPYAGRTGEFKIKDFGSERARFDNEAPEDEVGPAIEPIPTEPDRYAEGERFRSALKKARPVFETFADAAAQMIKTVRLGRPLDIQPVLEPVSGLVQSVIAHPDPVIWMTRLQPSDSYLIGHSQRTAVLSTVLGRSMGFKENHLVRLCLGGLLAQIGKCKLPRKLLEQPGPLEPKELDKIRSFILLGVKMLKETPVDGSVIEIVQNHHERFNGSGYPAGISGDAIPVLARLVGLADWYDAMTSRKPYTENVISSTQALDYLNSQRNKLFQDQLVEEFIKAVGLYPNGSLVELSTREIALVQSQNSRNRTQPQVIIALDDRHKPLERFERVNLLEWNRKHPDRPRTINRGLAEGELDLDARGLMEDFSSQQSGWRRFIPGS